jgi:GTP pyrophosphokinase
VGALGQRAERIVDVAWAKEQSGSFFVWVQVEALDRHKLLADITVALSDLGANITASSSATGSDRIAVFRFEIELADPKLLDRVISDLRSVPGVFDAYRLVPQTAG